MKQIYTIIISLIIVISLLYLYINYINVEKFGDPISNTYKAHTILDVAKQFPDIVIFNNDYDGRIGLDKCIEYSENKKGGKCVEYGLTGNTMYFPEISYPEKNFKDDINEPNETKLSYPTF